MTTSHFVAWALSVFLVGASGSGASALEQIKGAQFVQTADVVMSGDAQRALRQFKRSKFAFGAFFVSEDGLDWSWHTEMFSAEDAAALAQIECEAIAGERCIMAARMDPTNLVSGVGLPRFARKGYSEMVRKTNAGNFAAMAINGLSGWGSGFDFPDAVSARDRALRECEAESAAQRAKETDNAIRKAFDRNKIYDCRIVSTVQKQ